MEVNAAQFNLDFNKMMETYKQQHRESIIFSEMDNDNKRLHEKRNMKPKSKPVPKRYEGKTFGEIIEGLRGVWNQ